MKLRDALILICICIATGCATSRDSSESRKLAGQYAALTSPLDKAVFCLQHSAFFFKAPSDDEIARVFGEGAALPSVTTNRLIQAWWIDDHTTTNVQERVVRIDLYDERPPYDVQPPPP
jgi:hypothetical protein